MCREKTETLALANHQRIDQDVDELISSYAKAIKKSCDLLQLKIRSPKENRSCSVNEKTGEISCPSLGKKPPTEDCRLGWCPHRYTMRTRLLGRLQKYALEIKRLGGH